MRKIIGLVLLATGLAIIGWGLWGSYQIFTAKKEAPQLFTESKTNTQTSKSAVPLDEQAQKMVEEQFAKLIPQGGMTKLLNLIAWSVFMGILILAGGKISMIGAKLMSSRTKQTRINGRRGKGQYS